MKAIILCESERWRKVYGKRQLKRLAEIAEIEPRAYTLAEARASRAAREAEAVFSTWGMPAMSREEIPDVFPNLKAVFYAAGSVQGFARPFLERGVRVFSAWKANGVPVAQYALAQILLASKGYFRAQSAMRASRAEAARVFQQYPGMYEIKIGLLGCGAIGRMVAELLVDFDCDVWVYDPFVPNETLARLNARRATMEEIFAECDVVSNHLANLPATRGIIKRGHFFSMKSCATFVNTGRGAQLDEKDLCDMLAERPDVTALLDVLTDEGNSDTSPLNALPNCFLTPHIAGSSGNEVMRMAEYMIDESMRYLGGSDACHEVTLQMLETMA